MEAHGSFATASCTLCNRTHDAQEVKSSILKGPGVPKCGINGCKVQLKIFERELFDYMLRILNFIVWY